MNRQFEQALKQSDHFAITMNSLRDDYAEALAVVLATVAKFHGAEKTLKEFVAQESKCQKRPHSGRDLLLGVAKERLQAIAREQNA